MGRCPQRYELKSHKGEKMKKVKNLFLGLIAVFAVLPTYGAEEMAEMEVLLGVYCDGITETNGCTAIYEEIYEEMGLSEGEEF